jgi:transposase
VTVVTDLYNESHVLHVADDRKNRSLSEFYETLTPRQRGALEVVAMDMANSYIASTREHVPDADKKICFDRFHVAKLIGDALDKVRREEHRALLADGDLSLTRTKHLLLRRGDSLKPHEEGVIEIIRRLALKTARAWAIKEAAVKLWQFVSSGSIEKAWRKWIGWAMRSRLEPMKAAARTIRDHLWGIVNAVRHSAQANEMGSVAWLRLWRQRRSVPPAPEPDSLDLT